MSASLSVKVLDSLSIQDLILKTEFILRKILNGVEIPRIIVNEMQNGECFLPNERFIGKNGQFILIGFFNCSDSVSLSIIEVQLKLPYILEDEAGRWAKISVGTTKSPVEFALAAAVAGAFTIKKNTDIIDDGCVWTKEFKQQYKLFIERISVQVKVKDYTDASNLFFNKLNFRKD